MEPLVSVIIPSYNSQKTIGLCLQSIKLQSYSNIEIIVVDKSSKDATREIASAFGAKVINFDGRLLAARYLGFKMSKGEYVLLLDTDQILKPLTIERAVRLMNKYDMLILEEESYNREWFIPRLYWASKKVINARYNASYCFDPVKGGNPARFFKRGILLKAFEAIPAEIIDKIIFYDHDIIYYESYRISQKVGLLRDAVYHIEPDFMKLWRTNLRYGASIREVKKTKYWNLFLKKRGVGFWFTPSLIGIQAFLLSLILKTVQTLGYLGFRLNE